jgi:hypothetical protein
MQRTSLIFIAIAFILFGLSLAIPRVATVPHEATAASSTQISLAATTITASTTPITAEASSTPPKAASTAIKKVQATTTATAATQASQTLVATAPAPDFDAINKIARDAIVNILCTTKGGELSPISGTGIIISPGGLIITNAHIGQYFLLKDFTQKDFLTCIARTGSPASPKYNLELVYISPQWVSDNKTLLKEENPIGTGEHDFAFLRITSMIDGGNMPQNFSYLAPTTREAVFPDEPALLASYPAGFLGGLSVLQDLSLTSAIAHVAEAFTFGSSTVDLISVPGTVVSQKGSSGGSVVDTNAQLLGVIVTSSDGTTTAQRDLRAITLAYINRELQSDLDMTLEAFISQDIPSFAASFRQNEAPVLSKLIEDELLKN